jgi:hypothetical protein
MQPKSIILNANYPTVPVVVFGVILGLFGLAIGICGISSVHGALAAGRIYSVGIILNDTTMIYRSSSPVAYWAMISFLLVTIVVVIPLGIFVPISVVINYIKKLARQKKSNTTHQP